MLCFALCLIQSSSSAGKPSKNSAASNQQNDSKVEQPAIAIHDNSTNTTIKKKAKRNIPTFVNSSQPQQQQQQPPNHSPRGPEKRENVIPSPMVASSSSANNSSSKIKNSISFPHPSPVSSQEQEFMEWCRKVLGIDSILEIIYFPYPDFMKQQQAQLDESDDDDEFCDDVMLATKGKDPQKQQPPTEEQLQVRGLAASRDIDVGEVVLRIPYQALMTVTTIIDQDPVLSRVMGAQARVSYGWVEEDEDPSFYELPLLTVALLHHAKLGRASPLYHYLRILQTSPTEHMPVLWSKEKLRREANESVRKMAMDIRRDISEMYTTIVKVLKKNHPHLFAPSNKNDEDYFSLARFQWAFALVNSRHWHLPLPDSARRRQATIPSSRRHHVVDEAAQEVVPPASVPTEAWIRESQEAEALEEKEQQAVEPNKPTVQSFMAPLAELLNFGPPCTRGTYNSNIHSFEIIATCPYLKGQEVTFWYSDDCENVMISNYGFTHPMVPKCLTLDDWKQQAETLEADLRLASEELERTDKELELAQRRLQQCHCEDIPVERINSNQASVPVVNSPQEKPAPSTRLRHDQNGVRGGSNSPDASHGRIHGHVDNVADYERGHGVRRMWQERKKSDLGL